MLSLISIAIGAFSVSAEMINRSHPPLAQHPQTFKNGVFLKITPTGETFFKKHLDLILQSMSFYPDQGFFPLIENKLEIESSPDNQKRLDAVQDVLGKLIPGIKITPPTPILYFEDIGYIGNIKKLSMYVEHEKTAELKIQNGAIFKLDLEADQIHIETGKIGITDLSNEWAGKVALKDVQLESDPNSLPLKASALLKVEIDPKTFETQFQVLSIESNIQLLALNYNILGIQTPDIAVHVGKKKFNLNRNVIHEILSKNEAQLIENLKIWIYELVSTTLPNTLTKIMHTHLDGEFGQTIYFKPPGAPKTKPVPDFIMSFVASQLKTSDQGVDVELATRIWDPVNPETSLPQDKRIAKGTPNFAKLPIKEFDLGISMNKGLVNHLVQLSYNRGYFKKIELTNGDTASLTAAPQFETVPLPNGQVDPKRLRIWIKTKYKTTEFQQILVNKWVDVSFEITGYLIPGTNGSGVQFVCEKINENKLWFPKSNYKGIASYFHPFVEKQLKEFLINLNHEWEQKPLVFPQIIPIPPSFFGMPMNLIEYHLEANGFLTLYTKLPKGESL